MAFQEINFPKSFCQTPGVSPGRRRGQIADLDLNRKVIAVPAEELMAVSHRIAVAYGRHKVLVIGLAVRNGFINELITDTETALLLSEMAG